jgi:hypothetical protein
MKSRLRGLVRSDRYYILWSKIIHHYHRTESRVAVIITYPCNKQDPGSNLDLEPDYPDRCFPQRWDSTFNNTRPFPKMHFLIHHTQSSCLSLCYKCVHLTKS